MVEFFQGLCQNLLSSDREEFDPRLADESLLCLRENKLSVLFFDVSGLRLGSVGPREPVEPADDGMAGGGLCKVAARCLALSGTTCFEAGPSVAGAFSCSGAVEDFDGLLWLCCW